MEETVDRSNKLFLNAGKTLQKGYERVSEVSSCRELRMDIRNKKMKYRVEKGGKK